MRIWIRIQKPGRYKSYHDPALFANRMAKNCSRCKTDVSGGDFVEMPCGAKLHLKCLVCVCAKCKPRKPEPRAPARKAGPWPDTVRIINRSDYEVWLEDAAPDDASVIPPSGFAYNNKDSPTTVTRL